MELQLVVVKAFAGFRTGEQVSDPFKIEEILGSEHALNVVRVRAPAATNGQES